MRPIVALFVILFINSALIGSCKKEETPFNTDEVRLQAIEYNNANNSKSWFNFSYDANGRINNVSTSADNGAATSPYTIKYSGNEIILIFPVIDDGNLTIKDSIRLLLDGGQQRLSQRIYRSFQEFKAPVHNPQRTDVYDTTTYEYDAAGLLVKEIQRILDTTWFNPGTATTMFTRSIGVTNYTNNGGNAISSKKLVNSTSVTKSGGQTFLSNRSMETNQTYEYTKSYSNKTDFSNAVILNELQPFTSLPLNKNYKNIAEKISTSTIEKDGNGTVISTSNFVQNKQFGFNKYGFVSTRVDPATANLKTTFIYNK